MTEPEGTPADDPIGEVIGDLVGDVLDPNKSATKAIGDTIGQVVGQVVGQQPAPAPAGTSGMGGMFKDVLVDRDGDGTPDVFEQLSRPGTKAAVPRSEITHLRDDAKVEDFLQNALAQIGDKYQRGVENSLSNADPDSWDGSELVEWAANRAGVMVNDGAANQFRQMAGQGGAVSVEDAVRTPGAILYEFSGDPINGHPTHASTAISLGDGRIIDIDPKEGVRIVDASGFTFTHAAVMPGFTDAEDPGAGAFDVVHRALVEHGLEAAAPPVEDAPAPAPDRGPEGSSTPTRESPSAPDAPTVPDTDEITQLAQRAEHLRAQQLTVIRQELVDREQEFQDVHRQLLQTESTIEYQELQLESRRADMQKDQAQADAEERKAAEAAARGNVVEAEELREHAAKMLVAVRAGEENIAKFTADLEQSKAQAAAFTQREQEIEGAHDVRIADLNRAEDAIDAMENRVRAMREVNTQNSLAADLDRQATAARAAGNDAEAQRLADEGAAHRTAAQMAQTQLDAIEVDEQALGVLGGVDVMTQPPLDLSTPTATEPTPTMDPSPTAHAEPSTASGAPTVGDSDPTSTSAPSDTTTTSADPVWGVGAVPDPSAGDGTAAGESDPDFVSTIGATDAATTSDPGFTPDTIPDAPTDVDPGFTPATPDTIPDAPTDLDPGFTPDTIPDTPTDLDPGFTPATPDSPTDLDPGFTPAAPTEGAQDLVAGPDVTPVDDAATDDGF